ncbi:uncharacterized protein LOC111398078 [Olea europaea var. sylvestris]|uniref:uncharacterized protein LOC111398078 n=1 Tax=Olea europaea var. sylvestris TaxID=158386 RepID=UPI000C1D058B|nr:uncharacterized protein LOC111398078 [Olea europaea var. sylvestris]
MPSYEKFMKEILINKNKLEDLGTVMFNEECSAIINLMPYSISRKLKLGETKAALISLQLADMSIRFPRKIVEDILLKINKFIYLVDFVILDMVEEAKDEPLILGRLFLVIFNIFSAIKYPIESDSCLYIDMVYLAVEETFILEHPQDHLENFLIHSQDKKKSTVEEISQIAYIMESISPIRRK